MKPTQPSLAEQLAAAARATLAVEQGRSLGDVLPQVPARLRPGVQALTFHALRHWGEASALRALLLQRPPPASVHALVGVALTLLLPAAAQGSNTVYPAHTVVDQAVAALRALGQGERLSGLVNACLRRYLRERDTLTASALEDAVARWNHPFWWVQRVRRDHPQQWQAILAANNAPAPMVLRVNRRRISREDYLRALQAQGLQAWPVGPDGLVLERAVAVEVLPGWAQGQCSVQDAAAQRAAPLLIDGAALKAGARVLDACAAPGGKTAHLLECADLDLLALDADPQRAERIHDTLHRLGLKAEVRAADAAQTAEWWDGRPFDAILLDAPCTASGIVRRHPDVRWLRRASDVDQLVAQQRRLLAALWPTLAPGGRLLYCTCSVFCAEGEAQVQSFLQAQADALRLPAPGHLLPGGAAQSGEIGHNAECGEDGFFYALLQKSGRP